MRRIKVLLVEDHDSVSLGVMYSLNQSNKYDFEVTNVTNADQALEKINKNDYEILLLDLILKQTTQKVQLESGDELLRELQKMENRPKVIVMSKIESLDMLDYVINVLGAEAYILKSRTSLQEIIPAINSVMNNQNFYSDTIHELLKYDQNLLDIDIKDHIILKVLIGGVKQSKIPMEFEKRGISITLSGIEKRVKILREKFGANNTNELVAKVIKKGIV